MDGKKVYIMKWVAVLLIIGYSWFVFYKYAERTQEKGRQGTEDILRIVTSFYPMYLQTSTIAQGVSGVEIVNMVGSEVGCLHDYTLTTEDMKRVSRADVIITNGLGEEKFLEKLYGENTTLQAIDASSSWIRWYEDQYEGNETERGEVHHEEGHEGHEHGFINPHVWLSLQGTKLQLEVIANELSRIDPKNASIYSTNLEKAQREIQALQSDAREEQGGRVVSVHNTFQYLAEETGMEVVGIIPEGDYENPSPRKIEDIIKLIREKKVLVLLADERYKGSSILGIIQEETGCTIQFLDDMTMEKDGDGIERLRRNIQILREVKGNE